MVQNKNKRILLRLPPYLDMKASYLAKNLNYPYKADAIRFSIEFTDAHFRKKKNEISQSI